MVQNAKPPRIDDPDVLDRMAKVEGEAWRQEQVQKAKNPFGFFAYRDAWRAIVEAGWVGGITPHEALGLDMVPGVSAGDGAIYGAGGYARYYVGHDGFVRFDYGRATGAKQELARREGFLPG